MQTTKKHEDTRSKDTTKAPSWNLTRHDTSKSAIYNLQSKFRDAANNVDAQSAPLC